MNTLGLLNLEFDFDFNESFFKLIHGTGAKFWVLHPFNIFRYLAAILGYMMILLDKYAFDSSISQLTLNFIRIMFYINYFFLIAVVFLLVLPTEFILNVIDTLIFDPLRFVVEEIKQSYDYYDKEFLYVPSEEHNKVKMIYDALNLSAEENSNSPNIIPANLYTLEITSPEKKNQYTTCANGLFFKTYKNEPMFLKKDYKAIAAAHRTFENLERFYFFNKSIDALPNDMVKLIAATSLENEITEEGASIQFV